MQAEHHGSGESTRSRRTKKGVLLAAIPKHRLEQVFHLPLDTAAEELGLGLTAMKNLCRHHNLSRWPFRKMQCLKRFQPVLQAGSPSEDDLFRIYQLVKSVGLPLDHPLWQSYLQVDMQAAMGEYARRQRALSASMRPMPSEASPRSPSTSSLVACDDAVVSNTRSGSVAAGPATVIRIPVRNAISHLSGGGDMGGGPSTTIPATSAGPAFAPSHLARKSSQQHGGAVRVVSGAGYDEPSEVAEREGSVVTMGGGHVGGEGSGDSRAGARAKPAATERSDITGLHTTISRVSTLHPAKRKAPKQPAAAVEGVGDGCECGCVSQPVVGGGTKAPVIAAAKPPVVGAPMPPPHSKCMQCGGVSRTGAGGGGGAPQMVAAAAAAVCKGGAGAQGVACGHAAGHDDKVVVDKQELIKLLGMVKEIQGGDIEGWLQTLQK